MASKTALVTGCSDGGIGSAIVKALLKRGFHVFATTRSIKKMSTLADLPNVTLLAMDVTSAESIAEALKAVTAHTGGKLDLLVNNAGQGLVGPTTDVPMEHVHQLFEVNVFGLIAVTQAFVNLVVKAQGKILNIGSLAGQVFQPFVGNETPSL
jgi:1-acylglycerone phosphate reductase